MDNPWINRTLASVLSGCWFLLPFQETFWVTGFGLLRHHLMQFAEILSWEVLPLAQCSSCGVWVSEWEGFDSRGLTHLKVVGAWNLTIYFFGWQEYCFLFKKTLNVLFTFSFIHSVFHPSIHSSICSNIYWILNLSGCSLESKGESRMRWIKPCI